MLSGANTVNITSNAPVSTIIHEIFHKLGLGHEHQRPDRNNYIVVNESIIPSGGSTLYNYQIRNHYFTYGNFDFNSIMLYGSYADFNNDQIFDDKVMWKVGNVNATWTHPSSISNGDIATLNNLYPDITLTSSFDSNQRITLTWSSLPTAEGYKVHKYEGDYRGTLSDGWNNFASNVLQAYDYPYSEPIFSSFQLGQILPFWGDYKVVAVNAYGDHSKASNSILYSYTLSGGYGF